MTAFACEQSTLVPMYAPGATDVTRQTAVVDVDDYGAELKGGEADPDPQWTVGDTSSGEQGVDPATQEAVEAQSPRPSRRPSPATKPARGTPLRSVRDPLSGPETVDTGPSRGEVAVTADADQLYDAELASVRPACGDVGVIGPQYMREALDLTL